MAYYKEKYDGKPDTGGRRSPAAGPKSEGERAPQENVGRKRGGRGKRPEGTDAQLRETPAPQENAEPAKKQGIFGKLLGAFKKKPQ
jgi:hypothetical protein